MKVRVDETGKRYLETMARTDQPTVPGGFQGHIDARLDERKRTYEILRELARKRVGKLTTDDIQRFFTTMKSDGLSDSTIQKEIALLKAAFNSAIRVWKWKHFENPCIGIKLGSSNRRFVVLTDEAQERLYEAVARCDNPQVWPLVELAIVTTLRKGTLLSMRWDQVNLQTGQARLWAKGKWVDVMLSPRAIDLLKRVPRLGGAKVFTMSSNAVDMAWDGVRINAGLKSLQFRDLRHVGATFYAKAGFNAHQLQKVLTHASTRMAEVYVNLTNGDLQRALAEAEAKRNAPAGLPPMYDPAGPKKKPRSRKSGKDSIGQAPDNVVYLIRDGQRLVREEELRNERDKPPQTPRSGTA